jgi:uncharacterized membrane protein/DUF4097 and DUF4098 domain-containing protein YvlB
MNKYDFLRRLDRALSPLDEVERREILAFYEERFYTGTIYENKTEEQVIAELESPDQIARNVLEEYGIKHRPVRQSSGRNNETYKKVANKVTKSVSDYDKAGLVGLIILDLALFSWLIPTLFSVVVSLAGSILSYVAFFGFIAGDPTTYDTMIFVFASGMYIFLFLITLALLELFLWVCKKALLYHLRVFQYKKYANANKRLSRISVEAWFKRHRFLRFLKNISGVAAVVMVAYSGFFLFNHIDDIQELYLNQDELTDVFVIDSSAFDLEDFIINTDIDSMNVEIKTGTSDDVVITRTYHEVEGEEFDYDFSDNTITITHSLPTSIINFDVSLEEILSLFNEASIVIEVPSTMVFDSLDINVENGTIDIATIDASDITLDGSNGSITITDVSLDNMTIHSSNAKVVIRDVVGTSILDVETMNGRIVMSDTSFQEYNLITMNGDLILDNINQDLQDGVYMDAYTSNGDIELNNVYVAEVVAETINGNIDYNNEDESFDVDFESDTSNGHVDGNVK